MGWVADVVDNFGGPAGSLTGWTFEAFTNGWVVDGAGNAHATDSYKTSAINQTGAFAEQHAVEADLVCGANNADHAICLRSTGNPADDDDVVLIAGDELWLNAGFIGNVGSYGANPTIRVETSLDGDYNIFVDGVPEHSVAATYPAAGRSHAGLRGTSARLFAGFRLFSFIGDPPAGDPPAIMYPFGGMVYAGPLDGGEPDPPVPTPAGSSHGLGPGWKLDWICC